MHQVEIEGHEFALGSSYPEGWDTPWMGMFGLMADRAP
jgi:hypothetical protein